MEVSVALQGTLDTFALPDVLRLLAATKKSGRLRLTSGRGTGSTWVVTGEVVAVEANHAPHATESVDALFELLRFEEGAFTFDAGAQHADPRPPVDIEVLLTQAEDLLTEWRSIEAVVPSMDAWVTLARQLAEDQVMVDQDRWATLVAVGSGATVRRIADELCLPELPVSRAVRDLVEAGLADIAPSAPAGAGADAVSAVRRESGPARKELPLVNSNADEMETATTPDSPSKGPRARRARAVADAGPAQPTAVDGLAAAFPGLAKRTTDPSAPAVDDDLARQLATLSPRAADAVRAAAEATTDEERRSTLSDVEDDETLDRGLLLKFLSSVKS
jgi:hypothetical protein